MNYLRFFLIMFFAFCHLTREADSATAAEYAYDYLLQARDVFLTYFPKYLASIQKLQEAINAAAKTVDPSYYASISTINPASTVLLALGLADLTVLFKSLEGDLPADARGPFTDFIKKTDNNIEIYYASTTTPAPKECPRCILYPSKFTLINWSEVTKIDPTIKDGFCQGTSVKKTPTLTLLKRCCCLAQNNP